MRRRLIATAPGCVKRLRGARGPRIIGARDRGGAMSALVTSRREGALLYVALDRPEKRIGLVPDVGGTTRLVRTVGYAKAKELILTGRMIGAAEALAIGLVNQVVPPGEHVTAAARLAEEIAQNAPLAVGLAKRLVDL